MKRQVKVLKEIEPPRRIVSESEAREFISGVEEWPKKKHAEWRGKGRVPSTKSSRKV